MAMEGCGEKEICNLAVDRLLVQLANSGSFHDWTLLALCDNSTRARAIKPLDFVTKRLVSITLIFLFLPFFLDFLVSRFINIRLVLKGKKKRQEKSFKQLSRRTYSKYTYMITWGRKDRGAGNKAVDEATFPFANFFQSSFVIRVIFRHYWLPIFLLCLFLPQL